jgi:hypothetical protein
VFGAFKDRVREHFQQHDVRHSKPRAALYIDSPLNCHQIVAGDSSISLGSPRPSVSQGVARRCRSSQARTVARGLEPASRKVGSRRAIRSRGE